MYYTPFKQSCQYFLQSFLSFSIEKFAFGVYNIEKEVNQMDHKTIFSENLKMYMALSGKSRKDVCEALGYSYFTFSDWVTGKKMPRMDKVEQLANYFGILKSDLIEDKKKTATNNDSGMSEAKQRLLDLAQNCSDEDAAKLLQLMELFLQK
jgi:transcriptional regulator with XRE-family HTH domain